MICNSVCNTEVLKQQTAMTLMSYISDCRAAASVPFLSCHDWLNSTHTAVLGPSLQGYFYGFQKRSPFWVMPDDKGGFGLLAHWNWGLYSPVYIQSMRKRKPGGYPEARVTMLDIGRTQSERLRTWGQRDEVAKKSSVLTLFVTRRERTDIQISLRH